MAPSREPFSSAKSGLLGAGGANVLAQRMPVGLDGGLVGGDGRLVGGHGRLVSGYGGMLACGLVGFQLADIGVQEGTVSSGLGVVSVQFGFIGDDGRIGAD